jgi:hypothetical protein
MLPSMQRKFLAKQQFLKIITYHPTDVCYTLLEYKKMMLLDKQVAAKKNIMAEELKKVNEKPKVNVDVLVKRLYPAPKTEQ